MMIRILNQLLCHLKGGHEYVKTFELGKVAQRCIQCHHETPGWEIGRRQEVRKPIRGEADQSAAKRDEDIRRTIESILGLRDTLDA